MESRAKILGHPAHQILIVFPLGLLSTAVIVDLIQISTHSETASIVAYWMIAGGLLGGLVAAPFGWIDWFAIPAGTRAKSVGLLHGLLNVAVLGLFGCSWLIRPTAGDYPGTVALALSFAGAIFAVVGGWLGGELVSRLGVGLHDGAHLNSPNSLSGRPANEHSGKS